MMPGKRVLYIYRKYQHEYVSIEKIFNAIGDALPPGFELSRVELPYPTSGVFSILRNLWHLRKYDADLYHVTGDVHYAVFSFPTQRTVVTVHDSVFLHRSAGLKRWFLKKIFLDWPLHYVGKVTTVSAKTRDEIVGIAGISAAKVRVIPNPVLLETVRSDDRSSNMPRLMFIGSTPNKNLDRVLDAIAGLSCTLLLLGKYPDEVLARIKEMGICYELSFGVDEFELARLYHSADVLVYPSLYEGFGLPILEAQQSGTAVLTSDLSPMKEVAAGGALLVDPMDVQSIREGILKLLGDHDLRHDLVEKGLANVRQYGLKAIAGQYADLYLGMLQEKAPGIDKE